MAATLNDPAIVEHDDLIGVLHRAHPLGNHKRRAALHDSPERLLDAVFGLHVHTGGGVVENQQRRVEQEGTGNGHPLALAAGEGRTALTDNGVVPIGQVGNELVGLGRPRGRLDLAPRRLRPAKGDVLADGNGIQERFLHHDSDLAPQGREHEIAHVVAVSADRAVLSRRKNGGSATPELDLPAPVAPMMATV